MPLAPNCERIVAALAAEYPQEFKDCHRPELGARAWAFIRRVAWVLHSTVDQRFGLNGKRGNVNDPSMDAVSFRNPNSAAGGVEIIDVVAHAGETDPNKPQPEAAWIDQTQATINKGETGAFIQPEPVSGSAPPPATKPDSPSTTPTVCQFKTCGFDEIAFDGVFEAISELHVAQSQMASRMEALVATLVGHIDDAKGRIERVSQELANKPTGKCKIPW